MLHGVLILGLTAWLIARLVRKIPERWESGVVNCSTAVGATAGVVFALLYNHLDVETVSVIYVLAVIAAFLVFYSAVISLLTLFFCPAWWDEKREGRDWLTIAIAFLLAVVVAFMVGTWWPG